MANANQLTTVSSATEVVTPATARNWLKNNTDNRKVRWSHVDQLRSDFMSGHYTQTSSGIGFDVEGVLQNGQHRLLALSTMPENTRLYFTVVRGLPKASYQNEDRGVPRKVSDAIKVDRKLAEVLTFGVLISGAALRNQKVTPQEASPFLEFFQDVHEQVIGTFPGNPKTWGSAPVRAAVCFALRAGERPEYVLAQYKALCTGRLKDASDAAEALNVAFRNGTPKDKLETIARTFKALREQNSGMKMIKLGNTELPETIAYLKQIMEKFQG